MRFRLRRLLVFVALCCVVLAFYAVSIHQRNAELAAIEEMDQLIGYVERLHDDAEILCICGQSGTVQLRPWTPQWINRPLANYGCRVLYRVEEVSLWGLHFDDHTVGRLIEQLKAFSFLKELSICAHVSESGIRRLKAAFPNLEVTVEDLVRSRIVEAADNAVLDIAEGRYRRTVEIEDYIMRIDAGLPAGYPGATDIKNEKQTQVLRIRIALGEATGQEWEEFTSPFEAHDVSKSEEE